MGKKESLTEDVKQMSHGTKIHHRPPDTLARLDLCGSMVLNELGILIHSRRRRVAS
jgi:hypothetical protein